MIFLKRTLTAIAAILLISIGGSGTQSSSTILQGTGIIALIIGIVILFIFGKMILRAAGCLPTIFMIGVILLFILYAIGGFSQGISGVPFQIKEFLGAKQTATSNTTAVSASPMLTQNISAPQKKQAPQQPKKRGFNPLDYPAVIMTADVIKANVLQLSNGRTVRLLGIDAPDLDQTCSNKQGRSYRCGRQAALWLANWVSNYSVKCHIVKVDENQQGIGVCFLGQYDIAAATVNAGWAMATNEGGGIYRSYEDVANSERRGLWQGQFYKPSDWRKLRQQKGEIKVIKPKVKRKKEGLFGF